MEFKLHTWHIPPFPKPRGGLNKSGKMWHSNPKYLNWKKEFRSAIHGELTALDFQPAKNCLILIFHIRQKRGGLVDLENCQGAIQDALKTYGLISDDNYRILSNYVVLCREIKPKAKETSYIQFAVTSTRSQMIKAAWKLAEILDKLEEIS